MNADRFVRHLRMFWRAETIVADIRFRRAMRMLCGIGAALILILLAMVALSASAYLALAPLWGSVWAAAGIGGFHVWLAAIALLVAFKPGKNREIELAEDVRTETLQVLSEEIQEIRSDVAAFGRILRHPFDGALLGLLAPVISIILKSVKKTEADDTSK